jgi:predicted PurR-regulated permease PerM
MTNPRLQRKTFGFLLLVVTAAFALVLWPFFGALFWATVLAIMFSPFQRRLLRAWRGRRNVAALVTVSICVVGVLLPVALIAASLAREISQVVQDIQARRIDVGGVVQHFYAALPGWLLALLDRLGLGNIADVQDKLAAGAGQASKFMAAHVLSIGQNTFSFLVSLTLMLYVLFFLLRDGAALLAHIVEAVPLTMHHKKRLLGKFTTVIRATVKGNVVVALVQGFLGGMILWMLGVEGALLWGVLMALFSLLPAVGAAIVWAPIAVWMLFAGMLWKGVTLILFCVFVIGLIDNLLRPILVGKDTQMPDYLVLVSTLGGIALFGISGFVIGPVIAALFLAAWDLVAEAKEENGEQAAEVDDDTDSSVLDDV